MTIGRYSFQRIAQVIFLLGFMTLPDYGIAQSTAFQLEGKINNIESGTIQIWYSKQDPIIISAEDSVPLISGKFDIKGQLAYPGLIIMSLTTDKYYESGWFYIDSGKQTLILEIVEDHLQVKSTGNTFNEFISNFKNQMDDFKKMENELIQLSSIKEEVHVEEDKYKARHDFDLKMARLQDQKDSFLLNYIKQSPASMVGLFELSSFVYKNGSAPIYDSSFYYLDLKLKALPPGIRLKNKLELIRQLGVGSDFPPFKLNDTSRNHVFLNQLLTKKYILLDFWFHNCGACIIEFPGLKDIYLKWYDKGFEMVGISIDRSESDWKGAINEYHLTWPQYLDYSSRYSELNINYFPSNFLVDSTGKIVAKNITIPQLDDFLSKNLD